MTPQKRGEMTIRVLKRLFPKPKTVLRYRTRWQKLVSVMLSAQTTDLQVNKVTDVLFRKYRTIGEYANARIKQFEKDISAIGLFRNKAKHILATARILKEKHRSRVPQSMVELLALPGVGRKTAHVLLENRDGIAVDTHVVRLSRLFGLTREKDPKKIEQDLMKIIQKKEWPLFTHRMISYGRTYCPARCRHETCPIVRTFKHEM